MTVHILGRSEWGAGKLGSGHLVDHHQFKGLVVHHTVITSPPPTEAGVAAYMRSLQKARPDLGPEVPYSFVVFRAARRDDCWVAEGRGFGVTGAHTQGFNSSRYGVAYAGNAEVDEITPGVLAGYRWVGQHLSVPPVATIGHRDTKATACPGAHLYALLGQLQPPFEEDDDVTITELIKAIKAGELRTELKALVQGAGLDALRKPKAGEKDKGAWRGQIEEIVREVLTENDG